MRRRRGQLTEPAALYPADPQVQTPFLRARQEWDSRMGALWHRIGTLQRDRGLMALALLALAGGLVYQSTTAHVFPYVVQVSALGEVQAVGVIPQPWVGQTPGPIIFMVQDWIERMRGLGTDPVLFTQSWEKAKAFMTSKAIQVAAPHMRQQWERLKKGEAVQVTITSLLPVTPDYRAVQVEWDERSVAQSGVPATQAERWTCIVNVAIYQVKEVKQGKEMRNPLGLFVTSWQWSKKPTPVKESS